MNLRKPRTLSLLTAILAVLPAVVASTSADSITNPFSVKASLVSPHQISLGEPILMRYKITNMSSQKVLTDLGSNGSDWYTLTMTDGQGIPVSPRRDLHPVRSEETYSSKSGFFSADGSDIDYISVTKHLLIQHPGRYILTMHIKLPYIMDESLNEGTPKALAASSALTQTQEIAFPILVLPPDSKHLQYTAEVLRKGGSNSSDGQLERAKIDALFSMPEAQASASWSKLALKPSMSNDLVASELEELHTQTATDILVQMLEIPDLECVDLAGRINRVYNAANPALREHIKGLARQRGFEMPEVAGVPATMTPPDTRLGGTSF